MTGDSLHFRLWKGSEVREIHVGAAARFSQDSAEERLKLRTGGAAEGLTRWCLQLDCSASPPYSRPPSNQLHSGLYHLYINQQPKQFAQNYTHSYFKECTLIFPILVSCVSVENCLFKNPVFISLSPVIHILESCSRIISMTVVFKSPTCHEHIKFI